MATNSDSVSDGLWNLPASGFPDRATLYWDIVAKALSASEPLDILEIGVFRAGLIQGLMGRRDVQVRSYTGVDPYLGSRGDSYLGSYWNNRADAEADYRSASLVFKQFAGAELIRARSHEYFQQSGSRTWDVIIIDGDHRYGPALWDLHHWFKRLRPGGLLVADDYANSDTPEVTRAVNDFLARNTTAVARSGYRVLPFQNYGKQIPIALTVVFFEKLQSHDTGAWPYRHPPGPFLQIMKGLVRAMLGR